MLSQAPLVKNYGKIKGLGFSAYLQKSSANQGQPAGHNSCSWNEGMINELGHSVLINYSSQERRQEATLAPAQHVQKWTALCLTVLATT